MGIKTYTKRLFRYLIKGPEIIEKQHYTTTKIFITHPSGKLVGKTILVTGGGHGLGYAITEKAIKEGARCVISGRDENRLKEAVYHLGEKCTYLVCDMMNEKDINSLIECALNKNEISHFDSIVCNAGISLHEGRLLNVTFEDFDRQIQTNLKGNYFLAQNYIRHCIEHQNKNGDILFISSERGLQPDDLPYGLTKAAINSFVKGINKHYLDKGIRANAICPGVTCSEMTGYSSEDNLFVNYNNINRVMLPEEIAEVAVWLLSDVARCVTGEVIACDYGNYHCSVY